jgi:hypothetical protein
MGDFSDLELEEELGFEEEKPRKQAAVDTTPPEIKSMTDGEKLSQGEAALWAAGQGASLGFFDELLGAIGAGKEALTTGNKFKDLYPEYRDAARKLLSGAEEEHPTTMLAGELAGGLAMPVAAIGKLGKGATYLEKVKNAAKVGAAMGGITGAGGSVEDSALEVAKDAAIGAGMGATIGAGVEGVVAPVAKFGAEYAKNAYANSPVLKRILEAYDVGKANPDIFDDAGRKRIANTYSKAVEENIVPLLDQDLSRLGRSAYQGAKDTAESEGRGIDISNLITTLKSNDFKYTPASRYARDTVANDIVDKLVGNVDAEIKDAVKSDLKKVLNGKVDTQDFMEAIQDITESTTVSPEEAFKMRNKLQDLVGGLQEIPERDARLALKHMRHNLDEQIKSQEGLGIDLDKLDEEYRAITKFKSELRHDIADKPSVKGHDKAEVTAREALKNRFLRAHRDQGGDVAAQTEAAFGALKESGVMAPQEIEARLAKVQDAVKARSVADDMYGMLGMPSSDLGLLETLGLAMRSRLTQGVAGAGKAVGQLEKSAAFKGASNLMNLSSEELKKAADSIATKNPKMAELVRTIADKPVSKRKALLFTAMQHPDYREAFKNDPKEESTEP